MAARRAFEWIRTSKAQLVLDIFGFVKITPNIHNLINYKAIAGSHDNQIELLD